MAVAASRVTNQKQRCRNGVLYVIGNAVACFFALRLKIICPLPLFIHRTWVNSAIT